MSIKILPLKELSEVLETARAGTGKTVVQCHGCFDLLHIGHIRHFTEAKSKGDILVVTVTPDRFVNKGPGRPAFKEHLRLEAIASLDCVDYVALNEWPTAEETIELLRPDIYCKGPEYKNSNPDTNDYISKEQRIVEQVGGRMEFTEDITFSSSTLINSYLPVFSDDVTNFLNSFKLKYSVNDINRVIDSFQDLKILVMGETIIDEYHYVSTMGKSMKEPILASKFLTEEKFAGGILAIANHVSSFADNVDMLTFLGDKQTQKPFVLSSLKENINPILFTKKDSPTIVKRRFIEKDLVQKLFEVYDFNDDLISGRTEGNYLTWLEDNLPKYDLVIVADYGHGMRTEKAIEKVCKLSKFLCVNAQGNAGNQGNNSISKYHGADCISLAQHELVLEFRNKHIDPKEMVRSIAKSMDCKNVILTRGKYGTMCYREGEMDSVPAIAPKIVDRVGAGDAVLSLVAMAVCKKTPLDLCGFIGNAAGAEAVAIVGNRKSIEKIPYIKHMESLLK
ncbi:MAG: PfkB family carbohydrate kinase [Lentisphaeraceae bacterium]|nr:PfkB family carbohydrate kinase [Lentisphaeraceae bacterium]